MFCPTCGNQNVVTAQFCQACGSDLTVFKASGQAGVYAGFWQRAAATIIDSIIVGVIGGLLTAVTFGGGVGALLFLPWIYEAYMTSSEKQATFGKIMMGIVVVGLDGKRISFARATGRFFAKFLSGLLLGLGFLMAAFTERKQALHDMIAETLVVRQ